MVFSIRRKSCRWTFENKVLKRIMRDEIGDWRKLHNDKLHNCCSSPNTIRMVKLRMRWASRIHGREDECIQSFGGKTRKKETTRKTYM
jgi:hypothetical protein